jgi:hypothetical protein
VRAWNAAANNDPLLTVALAGAADSTFAVWSLPSVLACSPMRMPQPLSTQQARLAAVSAMAIDPVAELLAAGHCNGMVSVLNCSKPGAAEADS